MKKQFFIDNRQRLIEHIKKEHSLQTGSVQTGSVQTGSVQTGSVSEGSIQDKPVFLWANFEKPTTSFVQESTFYYFSGIVEPGTVLKISLDGETTLFIPHTNGLRAQWVADALTADQKTANELGVDRVEYLGGECKGYASSPLFNQETCSTLIDALKNESKIFTCYPQSGFHYTQQVAALDRLGTWVPELSSHITDISPLVASMRRVKQQVEVEFIFKAVQITSTALAGAAQVVEAKRFECDVQAGVEYVFTLSGASIAFPTIVASGKNGTILHYEKNDAELKEGELVIVDCGARVGHYCADLTRTFPISGAFSEEQRKFYNIVLECQDYISSLIKPGMYLNNKDKTAQSLHHLAVEFFDKKGLKKYFVHGIGHYLGLDPHDVGSLQEPLQEGDVIAIEPGLYIPEKNIGIRIEDNYWVIQDGAHCLSEDLPKACDEVEQLVQQALK